MAGSTKYFSQSWKLLMRNKGALRLLALVAIELVASNAILFVDLMLAQPLIQNGGVGIWLLLTLLLLVPMVVVSLGVQGYLLEQARLVAFGIEATPGASGGGIGRYLANGWRSFVVQLAYQLAFSLVIGTPLNMLARMLFGKSLPIFLLLPAIACSVILAQILTTLQMRAIVSRRIGAAFQLKHAWQTIRGDFGGLLRIVGMGIVVGLVVVLATFLVALASMALMSPVVSTLGEGLLAGGLLAPSAGTESMLEWQIAAVVSALSGMGVLVAVFAVIFLPVCYLLFIVIGLSYVATGLWTRQFGPAGWDGVRDVPAGAYGLPLPVEMAAGVAGDAQAPRQDTYAPADPASPQNDYADPAADASPYGAAGFDADGMVDPRASAYVDGHATGGVDAGADTTIPADTQAGRTPHADTDAETNLSSSPAPAAVAGPMRIADLMAGEVSTQGASDTPDLAQGETAVHGAVGISGGGSGSSPAGGSYGAAQAYATGSRGNADAPAPAGDGLADAKGTPSSAHSAPAPGAAAPGESSWQYDEDTGWYVDHSTGWYYDAGTGWYYDPATEWYYSETEGWYRDDGAER